MYAYIYIYMYILFSGGVFFSQTPVAVPPRLASESWSLLRYTILYSFDTHICLSTCVYIYI